MCVLKINYAKTVVFKDFLGLFPDQIRLSHRRPCYQLGYIRKNNLLNEKILMRNKILLQRVLILNKINPENVSYDKK